MTGWLEEDEQRFKEVEIINKADSLIYQTERMMKEAKTSIDPGQKSKADGMIEKLRDAIKSKRLAEVEKLTEELMEHPTNKLDG